MQINTKVAQIIFWIGFALFSILILFFLLTHFDRNNKGGDIAEYFGMTESIIRHGGIELTDQDRLHLGTSLSDAYFNDFQYYPKGKDSKRYPVHFFAYSLLASPFRIIADLSQGSWPQTFILTNWFFLTLSSALILYFFTKSSWEKIVFLTLVYLSPTMSFVTWPGPELVILCLLLTSIFCFFRKRYLFAIALSVIASWQSQPLYLIPIAYAISYFLQRKGHIAYGKTSFVLILGFLPTLYSLFAFGVTSPWSLFKGTPHEVTWTNITLQKTIEVIGDPNIGLLWYAPVLTVMGGFYFIRTILKNKIYIPIFVALLFILITYQMNSNWNNGTAGYGPTRYALFLIPFFIYSLYSHLHKSIRGYLLFAIYIVSQVYVLSLNGFYLPQFIHTLYLSPFAEFIMKHAPKLYNPTPEILIERTQHYEWYVQ